jgi:lipopolysaccharide/colanic/teichoic acid biosynthesis glycosyltransferase
MTVPMRPQDLTSAQSVGGVSSSSVGLYARYGKRMFDIALAVTLAPVAVVLVAICALVLLLQGQSPFYSQLRLGQGGRAFRIWKLRTMRPDAEVFLQQILANDPALRDEWNTTQKLKDDPRITPFGAFLRKSSIDELPQLLNVLRGEMSMIGPRPMMLDQAPLYGAGLHHYLSLRPGISGKWQVTERNDADFSRRAQIDAEYARELSLTVDLGIALRTVTTVVRSTGH